MSHELGRGAGQKVMLLFAIAGVGILLLSQAAYMDVFSYPVMSRSTANGTTYVNITYVNPLYSLFPVLLIGGISLSAYGFVKSRSLMGLHKRTIAAVFGIAGMATMVSLVNVTHQLTQGPADNYYYGFPLPWLLHSFIFIPSPTDSWIPTPLVVDDILFWAVIAYLSMWVVHRIKGLLR